MKAIKKVKVGKGKVVLYDKKTTFVLMFEYKEDKNNLLFVSGYGETLKELLNTLSITDEREDAVQFCFNMGENVWHYNEYEYSERSLKEDTVNVNKMDENEKLDAIEGFYSSLEEVNEIYGDSTNQIIAECYFENSIY